MTSKSGGPALDRGVSKPAQDERASDAVDEGGKPSSGGRGETPPAECAPIDLDTAHDRAS